MTGMWMYWLRNVARIATAQRYCIQSSNPTNICKKILSTDNTASFFIAIRLLNVLLAKLGFSRPVMAKFLVVASAPTFVARLYICET